MSMKWVRALSRAFSATMVTSLLVLTMAIPAVSAADEVISVTDVTLQDGTQTVQVRLQNIASLGSIDFKLEYDTSKVKAVAVQRGALPIGVETWVIDDAAGTVTGIWALLGGVTGIVDSVFFTVTFAPVTECAPTSFSHDSTFFDYSDASGNPLDAPTFVMGEYEVLPPTVVWIDDDFTGPTVDGGHTWGYNAFDDIQEGIDAVSASTVHVAAGSYSGFVIAGRSGLQVLGEAGAVVDTAPFAIGPGGQSLCGIDASDNILVQNLEFDGAVLGTGGSFRGAGIYCYNSSRITLDGVNVHDCYNPSDSHPSYAIYISSTTVAITNPNLHNNEVGVYVDNDTVSITGGSIEGLGASIPSTGIWADFDAIVSVSGTEVFDCSDTGGSVAPGAGFYETVGAGIYVADSATVTCTGCCKIHDNDGGIVVENYGLLTANGNNIERNDWGVVWEWYWTGEEPGTSVPPDLDCEENWWGYADGPGPGGTGNPVTDGVDFTPWLDGPCPGGNPVGMNAKLIGVPRSGEPGLTVEFTDLSTPVQGCDIISRLWDFGDGGTSTEQNPSHTYDKEGIYTVTLTVLDDCGFSDSVTMRAYITVRTAYSGDTAEDAKMSVCYLNIDPIHVLQNQEVVISANVCNQGGERGTKTATLMVNGNAEQSQTVSVSPGACQQVTFRISRAVPGTYQVGVDGMIGQFSVLAPRTVTQNVPTEQDTGIGTGGIIALVAVAIALIVGLVVIFKKE